MNVTNLCIHQFFKHTLDKWCASAIYFKRCGLSCASANFLNIIFT